MRSKREAGPSAGLGRPAPRCRGCLLIHALQSVRNRLRAGGRPPGRVTWGCPPAVAARRGAGQDGRMAACHPLWQTQQCPLGRAMLHQYPPAFSQAMLERPGAPAAHQQNSVNCRLPPHPCMQASPPMPPPPLQRDSAATRPTARLARPSGRTSAPSVSPAAAAAAAWAHGWWIAHGVDWEIAASSHTTPPVPVCDLPPPPPHRDPSNPAGKPGYEKNRYNVCNRCTRKGQTSDAWCAGQGRTQNGIHGRRQCLRCQRVAAARWQGHMCQ